MISYPEDNSVGLLAQLPRDWLEVDTKVKGNTVLRTWNKLILHMRLGFKYSVSFQGNDTSSVRYSQLGIVWKI